MCNDPSICNDPSMSNDLGMGNATVSSLASCFFQNWDKTVQFVRASVLRRHFPGAAAHFGERFRFVAQRADNRRYLRRVIRIGGDAASRFDDDSCRVTLLWRDSKHRTARSKC